MNNPPVILVVDDNENSRFCTVRWLQQAGYGTREAATGAAALDLLRGCRPNLVLLDVFLPDVDGRDLCQRIKADPELANPFVVLYSATKTSADMQSDGLDKGADGYMAQPITHREFLARVEAMLRIQKQEQQLRERTAELEAANGELITAQRNSERLVADLQQEIRERKLAQEALLASEQRLRRLGDNLPLGMVYQMVGELDGSRRFTYVSAGVERIHGVTADSVLLDPTILFHQVVEEDRSLLISKNDATFTHLDVFHVEIRIRKSSGEIRWIYISSTPSRLPDGRVICDGLELDITERKQIDQTHAFLLNCGLPNTGESFFKSLARYLAETLQMDYICIDRLAGDALCAETLAIYNAGQFENNVTYTLKDTPCGDVVGKTICVFPNKVRERFPRDAALQDLKAESYAGTTLWSSDGKPIGLIAVIGRSPLANPKLTESILSLVAIRAAGELERTHTELALKKSEEQYRLLVENAGEAIFVVQDGRLVYANPKSEEMIGYTTSQLFDRPFQDFIHPDDRALVMERYLQRQRGSPAPSRYAFRLLTSAGGVMWGQLNVVLIQWRGKPATLNFMSDTTQQKKMEDRLRETHKMEGIGHLAGGIAHEFNNILAAMMMEINFLENTSTDKQTVLALKDMMALATRAADLVRQLLAFGRKSIMRLQTLDLTTLLRKQSVLLQHVLGEKIKCTLLLAGESPQIYADPDMIQQAILNLCINAKDAMPKGGQLSIKLCEVVIDDLYAKGYMDAYPGQFACVSIADTGHGMEESTLKRLFEPFFTTKDVGKGTGLGLSTAYGIVKQHKGWIEVESQFGHGSTFRVLLPAAPSSAAPASPGMSGMSGQAPPENTVLLVEDEAVVRKAIRQFLNQHGCRVIEAENAEAALNLWEKHHTEIGFLYTDMVMSQGMSGLELSKRLRQDNASLKIIITSGYYNEVTGFEKTDADGIQFVPKPCPPDILNSILGKWFREE